MKCNCVKKAHTIILLIAVAALILFSNVDSFGQMGIGSSQKKSVKRPENFEHIDCGIRYPYPGEFTRSTAISHSSYRELGQGQINRFSSNPVMYDIGCIDLDDPPRKMKKDELIASLNLMTKAYLQDSFEVAPLPASTVGGREIYEFEVKSDFKRRIKYILEGNRVMIFIASTYDAGGIEEGLKLFNSVKYFAFKEIVENRLEVPLQNSLPQSPAVKLTQTDAAHNNLKGRVDRVKREAEYVPVLVGTEARRIVSDDTYDRAGNLLRSFWFQDSGYPTSVSMYGFIDGARVSDSNNFGYGTPSGISSAGQGEVNLPPADTRYEYRYEYKYDASKRLIERKEYDNRGELRRIHTFTYKDDWMEEKWFDTDGKLISTKRRQLDKNGNELKYEFWWYDQTDREEETYEYKKFDRLGNWTERRVVKRITAGKLVRTRTSNELRTITYYAK